MKKFFSKKKANIAIGLLTTVIFAQAVLLAKLFSERENHSYEVNLVKINTQKDSIDYPKMRNDLSVMDRTLHQLHSFLVSKNVPDDDIAALAQDSLSNAVYLAKQSNRYSQYLVDLQEKLQTVPLGMPTDGYISSNFGNRKNPIPFPEKVAAKPTPERAITKAEPAPEAQTQIIEEKDSLGNVIKRTIIPAPKVAVVKKPAKSAIATPKEVNGPPAEAYQIQFHKGVDIAVAYGTDVKCTAAGMVIFSGVKGGYGNCVIVSHGNGLATLYGHLSQLLVAENDKVKVGQVIAKSGNSGRSTGPHLHYEVHKNNTPVNPKLFLNF